MATQTAPAPTKREKKPRAKLTKATAMKKITGVLENLTKDVSPDAAKAVAESAAKLYS